MNRTFLGTHSRGTRSCLLAVMSTLVLAALLSPVRITVANASPVGSPPSGRLLGAGQAPHECTSADYAAGLTAYGVNYGDYWSEISNQWISAPFCFPRWGYLAASAPQIVDAGSTVTVSAIHDDGRVAAWIPTKGGMSWSVPGTPISGCTTTDLTCTVRMGTVATAPTEWQWNEFHVSGPGRYFVLPPSYAPRCQPADPCLDTYTQAWSFVGVRPVPAGLTADFTATPGVDSSTFTLTATSVDQRNRPLTHEWSFADDGSRASGPSVTHTFTAKGDVAVTLTTTADDGRRVSVTKPVTVPTLEISAVTFNPIAPVKGQPFSIDVAVKAVGATARGVKVAPPVPSPAGAATITAGPTPASQDIAAGQTLHFGFNLTAAIKGTLTLAIAATGTTANGLVSGRTVASKQINGDSSLLVTITPAKNDFTVAQNADGSTIPEVIDVKVEVENVTPATVKNVSAAPLTLFAVDVQHPYLDFPATVVAPNVDEVLGDLLAHQKKSYTRKLEVNRDGTIDIKTLLTSGEGLTSGQGRLHTMIDKKLKMVVKNWPTGSVVAGAGILLGGSFENLSNDTTVDLPKPMRPIVTGNIGGGYIAEDNPDPVARPLVAKLKGRDKKDFRVRLRTLQPSAEDIFDGAQWKPDWTAGSVTFLKPYAEVTGADGVARPLINSTVVVDPSMSISIDTSVPPPTDPFRFENVVLGLGGSGLEKVQEVLDSYWGALEAVAKFGYDEQYRTESMGTMARAVEYLRTVLVNLSASDVAHLGDEVAAILTPVLTGETSASIRQAVYAYNRQLETAWAGGDQAAIFAAVRPIGRATGELGSTFLLDEAVGRIVVKLVSARSVYRDAAAIGEIAKKEKIVEKSKSNFPTLEEYYEARQPIPDNIVSDYITGTEKAQAEAMDRAGIQSVLKPNEVDATRLIESGKAARKMEEIKNKSMALIEKLVFGGGDDVGKVLLRSDMPATEAEVEALFQKALAANGDLLKDEDIAAAKQIWKNRRKEWAGYNSGDLSTEFGRLKQWEEKGKIPFEFQALDNGVNLVKHFGFYDFALEPGVDAAGKKLEGYWVLKMRDPVTKQMMAISGDVDFLFFISKNGLAIGKPVREALYKSLLDFLTFLHPETGTWAVILKKKIAVLAAHFRDGAPLLTVKDGKWFAAKIDERWTRWRPGTTDQFYLHLLGVPTNFNMLKYLAPFTWAESTAKFPPWIPITALRRLFTPKPGPTGVVTNDVHYVASAGIYRPTPSGIERWTAATGWVADASATAAVDDGTLVLAPQTAVSTDSAVGDSRVEIASQAEGGIAGAWFNIGDQVIIDPGGPHEEIATISGFGSLIFTQPLTKAHAAGEMVAQLHAAAPAQNASPPGASTSATTGTLPQTGSEPWTRMILAAALIIAGAGLLCRRSRRTLWS